jgi:alpha-N-arabinofuranosidase
VSASASKSDGGEILLTLCNLHPTEVQMVHCECQDLSVTEVKGVVLAGDEITAHNTFDEPNRVQPATFHGATLEDDQYLTIQLPAASVVALTLN